MGTHSMTKQLVGDPADGNLNSLFPWIIKYLAVADIGLLRGNIFEE